MKSKHPTGGYRNPARGAIPLRPLILAYLSHMDEQRERQGLPRLKKVHVTPKQFRKFRDKPLMRSMLAIHDEDETIEEQFNPQTGGWERVGTPMPNGGTLRVGSPISPLAWRRQ